MDGTVSPLPQHSYGDMLMHSGKVFGDEAFGGD